MAFGDEHRIKQRKKLAMQSQPKDGDLVYNNHSDSANGIVCITDCTAREQVQH